MDGSYEIRQLRYSGAAVVGWPPRTVWAAVGDDTGAILFEGETEKEVLQWGARLADWHNGTWGGMSYEQYQSRD